MKSIIRWDPFRTMTLWDPFEEISTVQRNLDALLERLETGEVPSEVEADWTPAVENYTKDGKLVFKAELPGVKPEDVDVHISDRELVIKGERKDEKESKEEDCLCSEISYGSFERRFILPEGVKTEELKATFSNGILEVMVPAPALAQTRKIEIEVPKEEKKAIGSGMKKAA